MSGAEGSGGRRAEGCVESEVGASGVQGEVLQASLTNFFVDDAACAGDDDEIGRVDIAGGADEPDEALHACSAAEDKLDDSCSTAI